MCLLTHFECPRLLRKIGEYHVYSVAGERKRVCVCVRVVQVIT